MLQPGRVAINRRFEAGSLVTLSLDIADRVEMTRGEGNPDDKRRELQRHMGIIHWVSIED
jgi:hypothetical protein